ncbi:MAG: sugar transferase [Planctomycetes bacterium]|nr:sugar transferase [Planctomycetota bacterium]
MGSNAANTNGRSLSHGASAPPPPPPTLQPTDAAPPGATGASPLAGSPGLTPTPDPGRAPVLMPDPRPPGGLVKPILDELPVAILPESFDDPFVNGGVYLAFKRAMDLVLGVALLLLLAPLFALIALAIKLEDGGPVFFFQTRVGKDGREFRFWKFRSMVVDAEARRAAVKASAQADAVHDPLRFKLSADPRVTRVGRALRRFSLDELPQLWNVVAGDMSLVGPRPPIPEEVAQYEPRHRRRLEVEQGITCLWQVSGRNLLSFEQQVDLDLQYARRRSIGMDVMLLVRTIPAVLSGRGAC